MQSPLTPDWAKQFLGAEGEEEEGEEESLGLKCASKLFHGSETFCGRKCAIKQKHLA